MKKLKEMPKRQKALTIGGALAVVTLATTLSVVAGKSVSRKKAAKTNAANYEGTENCA